MEISNYSRVFKALSNEQRLRIFMMIYERWKKERDAALIPAEEGCCAVDRAFTKICSCMKLSRSTISHHFKELQAAGLITCERDGQSYKCRINEKSIESIKHFLK
ncbi:MAG: metalloregulator ArsR/SmtB family transcription factor [Elusimicrobia bacterium]|nr:metalloregulator ArsR/SmtB family transcription factor [Elusimicrobiota bacterium]